MGVEFSGVVRREGIFNMEAQSGASWILLVCGKVSILFGSSFAKVYDSACGVGTICFVLESLSVDADAFETTLLSTSMDRAVAVLLLFSLD